MRYILTCLLLLSVIANAQQTPVTNLKLDGSMDGNNQSITNVQDIWVHTLNDSTGNLAFDTINGWIYHNGVGYIDFGSTALNANGFPTVDWGGLYLYDTNQVTSLDWSGRVLYDTNGQLTVNWSDRILVNSASESVIDWENRRLLSQSPDMYIDWKDGLIQAGSSNENTRVANLYFSRLYFADGSTNYEVMNWQERQLYTDWTLNGSPIIASDTLSSYVGSMAYQSTNNYRQVIATNGPQRWIKSGSLYTSGSSNSSTHINLITATNTDFASFAGDKGYSYLLNTNTVSADGSFVRLVNMNTGADPQTTTWNITGRGAIVLGSFLQSDNLNTFNITGEGSITIGRGSTTGLRSMIVGGDYNAIASGIGSTVIGQANATASGNYSLVVGAGSSAKISSGDNSMVLGSGAASGSSSFTIGTSVSGSATGVYSYLLGNIGTVTALGRGSFAIGNVNSIGGGSSGSATTTMTGTNSYYIGNSTNAGTVSNLVSGYGAGYLGAWTANSTNVVSGLGAKNMGTILSGSTLVSGQGSILLANQTAGSSTISGSGSLLGGNISVSSTNSGIGAIGWGNNLKVTNDYSAAFGSNVATLLNNTAHSQAVYTKHVILGGINMPAAWATNDARVGEGSTVYIGNLNSLNGTNISIGTGCDIRLAANYGGEIIAKPYSKITSPVWMGGSGPTRLGGLSSLVSQQGSGVVESTNAASVPAGWPMNEYRVSSTLANSAVGVDNSVHYFSAVNPTLAAHSMLTSGSLHNIVYWAYEDDYGGFPLVSGVRSFLYTDDSVSQNRVLISGRNSFNTVVGSSTNNFNQTVMAGANINTKRNNSVRSNNGDFDDSYQGYAITSTNLTATTNTIIEVTEPATITLPTAVGNQGLLKIIINCSTGTVTVITTSSQTIGNATGSPTSTNLSPEVAIRLISNGANWRVY